MSRSCELPECSRSHYGRGLCRAHYKRWEKAGEAFDRSPINENHKSVLKYEPGTFCSEEGCTNPVSRRQLCQKHYLNLPEQRGRKAKWYQENRELSIKRAVQWETNNPARRAAINAQRKLSATKGMDEFDKEFSRDYREAIKNDPCFYCGNPGEQYDHYVSLINGGTDHWWNLVRACSACNWTKNRRNGDEFREGQAVPF